MQAVSQVDIDDSIIKQIRLNHTIGIEKNRQEISPDGFSDSLAMPMLK